MSGRGGKNTPTPEDTAPKPAGKKRGLRRLLTYAATALVVVIAALYLLRGIIVEPFLKSWLTATVRETLGPTLEIGDISGSYIAGLELHNIETIEEGAAGPLVSLDAERLTLRYSLLSLLGGLESFLGRLEVDLQGARADLVVSGGGEKKASAAPVSLPGALPHVRISDSSLTVSGTGFGADLSGIDLAIDGGSSAARIEVRLGRILLTHALLRERTFSLEADLGYTPEALTVGEILVDGTAVVEEGLFSFAGLPAAFDLEVKAKPFGGELAFQGKRKDGAFAFVTEAERLDVGRAASLFRFEKIAPGGTLSFQSLGRLAPHLPFGAEGEVSISLEEGTLRGANVVDLQLEAGLREGLLAIASLEGTAGASTLSLREGRLPLGRLVAGEWRDLLLETEANAALHSANIPSFLALWGVDAPESPGEVPSHELRLEGRLGKGTLDIHEGDLSLEGGSVVLNRAALSFPAPAEGWGEMKLSIDGEVDLEDAAILAELFPLPALGGAIRGRIQADGPVTALQGSFEAEAVAFVLAGRPLGDITLSAEADRERIRLRQGELRQDEKNILRVEEVSLPAAVLFSGEGGDILRSLEGEISLRLEDVPRFLETFGISREREAELVPEHLLSLGGRIDGGKITLSAGKLETPQGSVTVEEGRAALPGEGEDLLLTEIEGALAADLPDLRVLAELFAGPPLGGALRGNAQVRGTLRDLHGTVTAAIDGLSHDELLLGDATLEAVIGDGRLDLTGLDVRQGDDSIAASGSLLFDGLRIDDGTLNFRIGDVADYTTGLVPEKWQPRGSLEGKLSVAGPLSAPEGDLEAGFRAGAVGDIDIDSADVSLSAAADALTVRRFEAETGLGTFSLAGDSRIGYGSERGLTIDSTSIQGPPGIFRIGGSIGPDGALDFAVDADGLSGEGWLEEIVGDRVSFSGADLALRVEGSLGQPHLTATGAVAELGGQNAPDQLHGAFDLVYGDGVFQVHALSLKGEGGSLEAAGSIPFGGEKAAARPMDLTVSLDIPDLKAFAMLLPEGYAPRGLLRGEIRMGGSGADPEGQVVIEGADLFFPDGLKGSPPGPFAVNVNGSWTGDGLQIDLLDVDSEALNVKAAGSWKGAPAPGGILRGEKTRFAGDVALEAEIDAPDLSWIAGAVEGFRQTGGSVTGKLGATGPIDDPDVSASLRIEDGEVSFTGFPLLSTLDGSLTFAGKSLRLEEVTAEIGGSPTQLAGSLSFGDDWEPAFDLHLKGERLLLFRSEGMRLRADTEMSLTGPLSKLAVAGILGIVDSQFVRNIDFLGSLGGQKRPPIEGKEMLFSFPDPPLRDMSFDIAVKTTEPFRVRNQYLSSSVRPNVALKGTGEAPYLVGKVVIDPSRMYIPAGVLKTKGGELSFLERNPGRIWIDLDSSTRIMGYDIVMGVQGFADDPRITFTSLPPLPKDELLLLVMLGTPPASSDREVSQSAGGAMAAFLGRGFLGRFFGSSEGTEEMILDRFETTIGRDITEAGKPTVESTFRLVDGLLWKSDTLYLTGEKDRYDDVNYGVRLSVELGRKDDADE